MSCDLSYIIYVLSITYSSGSPTVEGKGCGGADPCTSSSSCTPTVVVALGLSKTKRKCRPRFGLFVLAKICQRGSLLILSVGSNFDKTKSVHKMLHVMS